MITWNIRNQIMLSGVIGLVALVGAIGYFYNFVEEEFESHSANIISLSNSQYANQLNQEFLRQANTFTEWTAEDVFGLSLEFSTTGELSGQFERWLAANDEFCLLALVDASGTVVEVAVGGSLPSEAAHLKGSVLPEFRLLDGGFFSSRASSVRTQEANRSGGDNAADQRRQGDPGPE